MTAIEEPRIRAFCAVAAEQGQALIEFSFLVPVLLLLCLGAFDFGMAIEQAMVVTSAAHAGAIYGIAEGNANDTAGMQTAANNAAKGVTGISSTATTWCTCTAGSSSTVSCASLCSTFYQPLQYVQVQTTVTLPLLFKFSTIPLSVQLSGNSILRAR